MEDGIRKALFELADREAGNMKDAETEKLLLGGCQVFSLDDSILGWLVWPLFL